MRNFLLPLAALVCATSAQAQLIDLSQQRITADIVKANLNPFDATFIANPDIVEGIKPFGESKARLAQQRPSLARYAEALPDTVQYFVVAQSYHNGYTFNYDGGDIFTYNVGLCIDGTKATFTNLFDMEAASAGSYYQSYDTPVEGVYDAEAKTITIATGNTGVICGNYMGGYYDAYLTAGVVSSAGVITPDEALIFDVTTAADGSIATITARSAMRASYTYGNIRIYKSFAANLPEEGKANLMTFVSSIDFGEGFVNTELQKSVTLVNNGGADADYVIELEAEDDAFTTPELTGVVPAKSTKELNFTFTSANPGTYEGIATVTYDNGTDEAYVVVDMTASAKAYPDYSAIIKSGEFEVTTGFEFPFEITTLEDGTTVATSTTYGRYGKSYLHLEFDVPEGKLATVAWKGWSNNVSYWYYNTAGYFVDTLNGAVMSQNGADEDFSGDYEFAPGHHFIRYQYESSYYSGLMDNYMYVYDIEYTESVLNADSAILVTPEVALGNKMLQNGGEAVLNGTVTLTNKGGNDLKVLEVTSDNAEFSANTSVDPVPSMKDLVVPVTMVATTTGDKVGHLTFHTTAGDFQVTVTASVMQMPDYQSLVTEGGEYITSWECNEAYPFIITDEGHARNINAGDNSASPYPYCNFCMHFTIPEGKLAYISWDGHAMGRPVVEGSYDHYYSSYANIETHHPMTSGTKSVYGSDVDAGSDAVFAADESWADQLACVPGDHYIRWNWAHNGDGTVPEGDYLDISNIKLHVIDFEANNAELLNPEVTFEPTYVGYNRYKTATVTLHNLGSENLTVSDYEPSDPFYALEVKETAGFNKNLKVTLWFYPSEPGDFDGTLTLHTSAGDFDVLCHGTALDAEAEGLLLVGDFEDDAYGWTTADPDHDGETWNLGTNLWGERAEYAHSGVQCLASISYSNNLGAIEPDNWTFSPYFTVPEQGADLSYFIAAFSPSRWEEHYSLYIVEDVTNLDSIAATEPVISETLLEEHGAMDGWAERNFSLDQWAGKTIALCYRHHDCLGQYIIRLDDVFVKAKDPIVGISTIRTEAAQRIFSIDGRRVSQPVRGGLYVIDGQKVIK